MSEAPRDLPASVLARLSNRAREQDRPFQEVFQYYAIERFLHRLAQSDHRDRFVLKGGVVFFGWGISLRRPTRDIDLHGHPPGTVENLEETIRDICGQSVEPDGMRYDADSIRGEVIQDQAEYEGVRIRFTGYLGTAQVYMQIDVGFSDVIVPPAIIVDYPTILSMPQPRIRAYAYETLIAEKLQAMVFLGSINSRMKDFYDVWLLTQEATIDGSMLLHAIRTTFRNRNTSLPDNMPLPLSESFAEENQQQWRAFLRRGAMDVPEGFAEVVADLRSFFLPVLDSARNGGDFNEVWKPGREWILA